MKSKGILIKSGRPLVTEKYVYRSGGRLLKELIRDDGLSSMSVDTVRLQ